MSQPTPIPIQTQLILNCLQLSLYIILLILTLIKLIRSFKNNKIFLKKLYIFIIVLILISIGLQSYQIVELNIQNQPNIYLMIVVNIYAISIEAIIIFLLADYWHQTGQILSKQSNQNQVEESRHYVRWILCGIFITLFSAYIGYGFGSNNFQNNSQIFNKILSLGCQGIAAVIVLWAVTLQIISGKLLMRVINRYAQWLHTISLKKMQFNCIFWISSLFSLIRLAFLIVVTVFFEFDLLVKNGWMWLGAYVYTFISIVILVVYIFGFSTKETIKAGTTTLITQRVVVDQEVRSNPRSRHQTQLSSSVSDQHSPVFDKI